MEAFNADGALGVAIDAEAKLALFTRERGLIGGI
jgi:hypothetical protein